MSEDFGLVQWDSVEFYQRNSDKKKDEFIKLQSGSNVLRIVTRPFQYSFHKWKEPGESGWGDKVKCSIYHGECPLCTKGDRPKRRWYIGVIDRKTQSYKILDMSPSVFQKIQKFTRNEKWGDPGNYDIDVVVDKDAGANGYYTVMPLPKEPLSDRDVDIKQNEVDVKALEQRCTPPKPEEVTRRLRLLKEDKMKKAGIQVNHSAAAAPTVAADADEDFDDFPPAKVTVS